MNPTGLINQAPTIKVIIVAAKTIMVQGTGSHVGKSILVTALCRLFAREGYKVCPFKAQNMALNSCVVQGGGEIGWAQFAQAEAAGIEPTVDMNPVLLKPTGECGSQVILHGKPIGNMSAREYYKYREGALDAVKESFGRLASEYEVIVIEGAGSPAEINLKSNDIVNMKVAELANAPVLLISDIDRGGVFAWLVGTMELLTEEEKDRVKGVVINKFRGDMSLLKDGLYLLEDRIKRPVIGVIPYFKDIKIMDEDSVSLDERKVQRPVGQASRLSSNALDIVVIRLPRISNFTDFIPLEESEGVRLRYVDNINDFGNPDLVIIPGTKNTLEDMVYLKKSELAQAILDVAHKGTRIIGICGGFQMLGKEIHDPFGIESGHEKVKGLGLIEAVTVMEREKVTSQVKAVGLEKLEFLNEGDEVSGYEIHMGKTDLSGLARPLFKIIERNGNRVQVMDGAVVNGGNVIGTYIHGLFDNDVFRNNLLGSLRKKKGTRLKYAEANPYAAKKEENYNKLAEIVRKNLDMKFIMDLIK